MGGNWQEYLPDTSTIITAGALVGALVAIWAFLKKVTQTLARRFEPLIEQCRKALLVINGRDAITLPENPGQIVSEAIPGALERLEEIEQTQGKLIVHLGQLARSLNSASEEITQVKNEVTHNHGTSLKDAVRRVETAIGESAEHLSRIDHRLEDGNQRFEEIEQVLEVQSNIMDNFAQSQKMMWPAIEAVAKSSPPDEPAEEAPSSYSEGEMKEKE